jgi:RNA polymerase sigma-70 factor (ECF subfamily)
MDRWHPRPPAGRASLSTTHWSVILRAGGGGAGSAEALASLCDTYWYPLYAYARRRGYPVEDAQDLTQGFFVRLLARDLVAKVSPERGRFRSFLLTSFKHHLANEADAAAARKRGGGQQVLSLDNAEARYEREPVDHLTPEGLYERQWALTVIGKVLNELEREAEQDGKRAQFQELRLLLTDDENTASTVGARLDMTEGAVRVAVHRLRRRFAELLRERIAETVESAEAIDDELRHLLEAVAPPPP